VVYNWYTFLANQSEKTMATNIELKNAKAKESDYTIPVDMGLSLLVKSTGSKLWRFRYSFSGKRCMISLGKYPQISMKQAKAKQREYLDMIEDGVNPSAQKQIQKIKQTIKRPFKDIALDWHAKHYRQSNDRYTKLVLSRLDRYIFPIIGKIPLENIEAPMLFNIIESIQAKGNVVTGKCINSYCSMIFRYGVAKGYCTRDITQDYRGMLKTVKSKNMPVLTDAHEVGELLRDMDEYVGTTIIKSALAISAYIFVRPSELACSKWSYIDFDNSQWIIPAEHMKMKQDHLIPFPKQVNDILQKLYPITSNGEYIFPNASNLSKPMHGETVNKTLRRIKKGKYIGRMVSHGFRGMASTILNEHKFRSDVVEKQLAHQERNKVREAYNRAEYLEERTEMMQWYADHLDKLRADNLNS
jgi:integrase